MTYRGMRWLNVPSGGRVHHDRDRLCSYESHPRCPAGRSRYSARQPFGPASVSHIPRPQCHAAKRRTRMGSRYHPDLSDAHGRAPRAGRCPMTPVSNPHSPLHLPDGLHLVTRRIAEIGCMPYDGLSVLHEEDPEFVLLRPLDLLFWDTVPSRAEIRRRRKERVLTLTKAGTIRTVRERSIMRLVRRPLTNATASRSRLSMTSMPCWRTPRWYGSQAPMICCSEIMGRVRGGGGSAGENIQDTGPSALSATQHLSATGVRSGGVARAAAHRIPETASSVASTSTGTTTR